ncbi:MAG: tetratricopeptide repeat-containing diguanylate cyclase, partial [Acidaminobacteraceae bacterium]
TMLDNKGDICLLKGEYIKAYEYFNESYDILKKENDPIHLSEAENRLGKAHYYSDDYDTATLYFESALNRLEEVDNKFYSAEVLINIAKLNFVNDQRKSFNSLERAIDYAEKTNSKKKMSEVYALAAELYEKTNNFKIALEYFKKHHFTEQEIKTSIMSEKLEVIKMELARLDVDNTMDEVMAINKQLENEISYQNNELKKIQNINVNLEKRVFEDSLTEIPNRNYLDCNLVEYMRSCLENNEIMILFMIDIDFFKRYNDYWGHLKGDECLKSVAKVFKNIQEVRNDILGRYGGEEFIYCSKVPNYKAAMELGNLLRSEVELLKHRYSFENNDNLLTISLGGTLVSPLSITNIFDVIEVADQELYKGKDRGRNIVMIREI